MPRNEEHATQAAVVAWARAAADTGYAEHPDGRRVKLDGRACLALRYLHHARNGGASKGENGRAKALGTVAGWPDLFLPYVRANSATVEVKDGAVDVDVSGGLLIEMKAPKGRTSERQRWAHTSLGALGYRVEVCRSYDEARRAILDYLT